MLFNKEDNTSFLFKVLQKFGKGLWVCQCIFLSKKMEGPYEMIEVFSLEYDYWVFSFFYLLICWVCDFEIKERSKKEYAIWNVLLVESFY